MRIVYPPFLLFGLILGLDQASKYWILYVFELPQRYSVELLPFLNFTMVWNRGVSFGLFDGGSDTGRWLLVALTVLITIVLISWAFRTPNQLLRLALAAIIGGAVGNVIDRVIYGAVADFIDVHAFGWHFWTFNVADAAISLGVVVLFFDSFFGKSKA